MPDWTFGFYSCQLDSYVPKKNVNTSQFSRNLKPVLKMPDLKPKSSKTLQQMQNPGWKAVTGTEEAKIAAEKAKHSAEEAKDSEKAVAKLKLEAEQAKAI